MTISVPRPTKPSLRIPKVSGWFLIAALIAQNLIMNTGKPVEPICTLKLDWPHYSTSLGKNGINAIKLNIDSECNLPQRYSELTSIIEKYESGTVRIFYQSRSTKVTPPKQSPRIAEFRDFWSKCEENSLGSYRGRAEGRVQLEDGRLIAVTGTTGIFRPIRCLPRAK